MQDQQSGNIKIILTVTAVIVATITVVGFLWFLFLAPQAGDIGSVGWYLFAFAAGLTMIILPCTLPLAFVIVPLAMGKGLVKGLGMALSFGLGVALVLSAYGVLAALAGKAGLSLMGAQVEDVKNWVYFFAGIFAYLFALTEIGLLKLRMPSYTGSAPDFIQQRKDYLKAFLLGLFLGNIGVGCPHPATPLILIEIASSADVFYGWSLFFVHAIGRVLPLLLLAVLAVLGVNGLNWLVARKERIERTTGWAMVFVAGFILTLGLFTHDWWVNSGQHVMLEKITQEDYFTDTINVQLGTELPHRHGVASGTGIFGQPLLWGNWFIVFLWVLPLWWFYARERRRVLGSPALQLKKLEHQLVRLEEERRGLEVALHIPEGAQGARVGEIEAQMDGLSKERMLLEEGMRYGAENAFRDDVAQAHEAQVLGLRRNWYVTLSVLLIVVFSIFLPFWFMNFEGVKGDVHDDTVAAHDENDGHSHAEENTAMMMTMPAVGTTPVRDAIRAIDAAKQTPVIDESKPHGH